MRYALFALALVLSACGSDSDLEVAPETPAVESADLEVAPTPGAQAPAFTLVDTNGIEHTLEDYAGKTVVLEWLNYDCPFVGKHYGGGNMQALQERYTAEDVVWLSVVSSAPGEQGYFEADAMNERTTSEGGLQSAVLLDASGDVGRLYDARTTPQMVVIDAEGKVAYNGAIDDKPTTDQADLEGATNYVIPAIAAAAEGVMSDPATTQPYGCSVKYGV